MSILFIHAVGPYRSRCSWDCPLRDVEFVSIQKEVAANGCASTRPELRQRSGAGQSISFLDTAAILANCDLLISLTAPCASRRRHGSTNLAGPALDPGMAMGVKR